MAQQQHRRHLVRSLAHQSDQLGHPGVVDAADQPDFAGGGPDGLRPFPGLAGPRGGGAEHQVRSEPPLHEHPAQRVGVPATAAGQGSVVVVDVLFPDDLACRTAISVRPAAELMG